MAGAEELAPEALASNFSRRGHSTQLPSASGPWLGGELRGKHGDYADQRISQKRAEVRRLRSIVTGEDRVFPLHSRPENWKTKSDRFFGGDGTGRGFCVHKDDV